MALPLLPTARLAGAILVAGVGFLWSVEAGLALNLVLVVLIAADAAALLRSGPPEVERRVPGRVDLGGEIEIETVFTGARPVRLQWTDDPGPGLVRIPEGPRSVVIPPGGTAVSTTRVRGELRGHWEIGSIHLRVRGPLGLVLRRFVLERSDPVSVQPGLRALRRQRTPGLRYLRDAGAHRLRHRDGGREFARLREYVRGDDPRRIDWKATGRRGDVIVREFEAERSQNLVLALDAGRLMTEAFAGRERLDHALAAALVLADAARTHGDSVGVLLFADTVQSYLPPGRHTLSRIADTLASVQARRVEPDYPRAFGTLARKLRRRSLVVLFSDVVDPRTSRTLLAHMSANARRHLPLLVAIRNVALEEVVVAPTLDRKDAYRKAAAEELLEEREVALNAVRRQGVLVADVRPEAVISDVLARYAEVKRRGLL